LATRPPRRHGGEVAAGGLHAEVSISGPIMGTQCEAEAVLFCSGDHVRPRARRQVPAQQEARERETGRIVLFPTRLSPATGKRPKHVGKLAKARIADLRKYEQGAEPDDYPHRMAINAVAFAFMVLLTCAGIWLAEQLALSHKQQDCVFSGRKNCVDVDAQIRNR